MHWKQGGEKIQKIKSATRKEADSQSETLPERWSLPYKSIQINKAIRWYFGNLWSMMFW